MFFHTATLGCENITVDELRAKMSAGSDFMLLDVRTPMENSAQAIAGSYLIPIQELASRIHELPKGKEIVVYCRVGNRSAYACMFLSRIGFRVKNLEGGIQVWNASEQTAAAAK